MSDYMSVDQLPDDEIEAFVNGEVLAEDAAAHQFPVYPLDSPGMPAPGLNIILQAEELFGEEICPRSTVKKTGERKVKYVDSVDIRRHPAIVEFYWSMLYPSPSTRIKVQGVKGKANVQVEGMQTEYMVDVLGGHLWDPTTDEPGAFHVPLGPVRPDSDPVVMVVGKMPGLPEVKERRILTGNLKEYLEEVIVGNCEYPEELLSDWYVTTVIKWLDPSPSGRATPKAWVKDCAPILQQEVKLVRPDYILCLGSEAAQAFIPGAKVTELSGVVSTYEYCTHFNGEDPVLHQAKLMCVPNPGAILHNPDLEDQFISDIRRFTSLVQGLPVDEEHGIEVVSCTDIDHLRREVDEVLERPGLRVIAVDGEWHGEVNDLKSYLRTIQFCSDGVRGVCIELTGPGGVWIFDGSLEQISTELQRLFYAERVQLCGSFFNADEPWLASIGVPLSEFYTVPPDVEDVRGGDYEGGFDVALAAHAYDETGNYKLEIMGVRFCGARRWDVDLNRWITAHCKEQKIGKKQLEGYGMVPRDILLEYGARDVIYTWRLRERFCSLLSSDTHGNDCWKPFHTSMLAFPAFGEISKEGLFVDVNEAASMANAYRAAMQELEFQFQRDIEWPDFNHRSLFHVREFLFGEELNRKVPGSGIRLRPEGAMTLSLTPVLAAGKRTKPWEQVVRKGTDKYMNPSTNSTVLGILAEQSPFASQFADIRYIDQVIKMFLSAPTPNDGLDHEDGEEDGEDSEVEVPLDYVWEKGNLRYIRDDHKVHPFLTQTKETGRAAAARPNIMALSKSREADYARILDEHYTQPIRCIFVANDPTGREPGGPYVFLEADFSTAELLTVGVQAQDRNMIKHCLNPEYDIHSQVAVKAFNLPCPPTKEGVNGYRKGLRNAAKTVVFGSNYLQGPEGLATNINKQKEIKVTVEDARALQESLYTIYDCIPVYQNECKIRVTRERWMRSCKGRLRRFGRSNNDMVIAGMERQAANFAIQSTVADVMSEVMSEFYWHESRERLRYRIVAQIHDALLFRLPVSSLDEFANDVLPQCMVHNVFFQSCDLDGNVYSGPWADWKFRYAIEYEVMERWGKKLTEDDCRRLKIDPRYSKDIAYCYPGSETMLGA